MTRGEAFSPQPFPHMSATELLEHALSPTEMEYPNSTVADFIALLKPRVMSLVVFCGGIGMLLAPGHLHPALQLITVLCIALATGASGAINMWYESDLDAQMQRTRNRPIPAGRMHPSNALALGSILCFFSVAVLGLATNWLAAFWLLMAIAVYLGIYTFWLKRRSPQNIVIGGAAGAFPPLIGWAAVTGQTPLMAWVLFGIIFLWTPPHFWALALYKNADYAKAGIPMLPVVKGASHTKRYILLYSLLMVTLSLLPAFLPQGLGLPYALIACLLGSLFLWKALRLLRDGHNAYGPDAGDHQPQADQQPRSLFFYSILYLFVLFSAMLLDHWFA